jgi:hypothetical protein
MTAIDLHEWNLYLASQPDAPLRVIDGTVDIDDEWAPMIQARLTLADEPPSPLGSTVEPYYLEMFQSVGPEVQHLRDLTTMFGGGTLADVTAAWEGHPLSVLDSLYDRAWDADSGLSPTSRRVRMFAREVAGNGDGTWALTLHTQESILGEYATTAPRAIDAPLVSRAIDRFIELEFSVPTIGTVTVLEDGPIPEGLSDDHPGQQRVPMEPGDTLVDSLAGSLQFNKLRILDFGDGLRLCSADWTNDDTIELSEAVSVISAPPVYDREEWFDILIVIFSQDKTPTGIPYYGHTRGTGFFPPVAAPLKSRTIQIDSAAPFRSSDQSAIERVLAPIADRLRRQGSRTQVSAVARYDAFPRAQVTVAQADATLTGVACRVTFTLSDRTMSLDLREVAVA